MTIFYFIVPHRYRWIWLLASSYFFYMSYNPKYAVLLITCTLITYTGGILISKSRKTQTKKLFVFLSISINIGILFMFKYYNFFDQIFKKIFLIFGISLNIPSFDFLLPVGISFYTFQSISYIVDVYRADVEVQKNFGKYALFISFFPQILSGPIQKSKNFMHQFDEKHYFDYNRVKNGLLLMLWGYFQKMMAADRLGDFVNTVYNHPSNYKGFEIVIATIMFAFQLYFDFSSYSDIALGASEVMGFKLSKNFERPYFAKSISEFWRRWHMSLTSWLTDYVYFPLGGSRYGKIKSYRNILIVFLVSGIWHGVGTTFIIWGLLHGIYSIFEKALKPKLAEITEKLRINTNSFNYRLVQIVVNFVLVDFAWLFFRANCLKDSAILIKNSFYFNPEIFTNGSIYNLGLDQINFFIALASSIFILCVNFIQRKYNIRDKLSKQNINMRWSLYVASVIIILVFGIYGDEYNVQKFIYSQF